MAKVTKVNVILPAGIARFPNLWVPRAFSKPGQAPGKPKFDIGVVYDAPAIKKVEAIYKDAWAQFCANPGSDFEVENYKSPIKKDKKDKTIKFLNAHSSDKYKPPVFDSRNRPLSKEFGGGSKVVLDVSLKPYDGFGGGITTYINAVQVIEFVEGGGFTGPRFDQVEDGYEGEDEDEESVGDNTTSPFAEGAEDEEEDHNF